MEDNEKNEKGLDLSKIPESINLAEDLEEEELNEIGEEAYNGYKADLDSRKQFEKHLDTWTQLALQIASPKTHPWSGASNVKFPLLATAAMQFAARSYPSLVPSTGDIVKCKVLGSDPDGQKKERAIRVGKYMSYQILEEMEEWEEEMDKLLITLPIAGTVFKKTYWDSEKERNVSCVIMPKNLVVNYYAKDLDSAERVTETYTLTKRKVEEKIRAGLFSKMNLGDPVVNAPTDSSDQHESTPPPVDDTTPYVFCEQHTYLDLDEDGYAEPYVVTFEEESKQVARIVARFGLEDVKMNEKEEVVRIIPQQYYTKYGFVPNPDGGFYDIGFGRLLGPLNESADTLINQLIDAGSLSNMQSGFIAKGLRIKMGEASFKPGEWKAVNATGQDLKQSIMPLPLREPSAVLMQLLQFLIQAGKELASVAEIMVGKMPGQNTPATTTMATIEQGMKVFTAVYKRVFRSMTKEFRKLYKLNKIYLNPQTEVDFQDVPLEQSDFQGSEGDIIPAADPASVSSQEKQAKIEKVGQLLQLGTINPMEYTKRYLDAYEISGVEQLLMEPQPPQPDPEEERAKMEAQIAQQESQQKMSNEERKMAIKEAQGQSKISAEREASKQKIQEASVMGDIKARNALIGTVMQRNAEAQGHRQKLTQQQQKHALQMRQQAEKQASKPKKG
jgi:chaperonin GroES